MEATSGLSSGAARKKAKVAVGVVAILALVALVAAGVTVGAVYGAPGAGDSRGDTATERERIAPDHGTLPGKVSHQLQVKMCASWVCVVLVG